jgi:hypothetical protein
MRWARSAGRGPRSRASPGRHDLHDYAILMLHFAFKRRSTVRTSVNLGQRRSTLKNFLPRPGCLCKMRSSSQQKRRKPWRSALFRRAWQSPSRHGVRRQSASGDGAFARTRKPRVFADRGPHESGVALPAAVHDGPRNSDAPGNSLRVLDCAGVRSRKFR